MARNGHDAGDTLRRRFVEAARRAEIIGLINAATNEAELALSFAEELCEVFDAEVAFVLDGGGERGPPRAVAAVGLHPGTALAVIGAEEFARAAHEGRAVAISGRDVLGIGAPAVLLAPFRTEDGRSAMVGVARLYDETFEETDRSLVETVTVAAGQAFERIWAYEARDRAAAEQAALVRAAKSMSRSLEISGVLQMLCEEVRRALGGDVVGALLGDEVDGYVCVGAAGIDLLGFRQSAGTGLGGQAVRAGRTMVTHAYQEDGYAPPEATALANVRAAIAAPIRWDGRIRAYVSAGFYGDRRITPSEVELLEGFAELAGLACANAERHAAVREAAEIDWLTGCLNRDALQGRLREMVSRSEASGEPISLALLDLDDFKSINDVFGHPAGDTVLKRVGAALRSSVRAGDLVARYGGDEFALILPKATDQEAGPVLDRVRTAIRTMDVPGGRLTACVGLAGRGEGESVPDLIGRADEALREAKAGASPGSIRRASRRMHASLASVSGDGERRYRWRAAAGDIGLALSRETEPSGAAEVAVSELRDVLELSSCAVVRLGARGKLEPIAWEGREPTASSIDERGTVSLSLREKRAILGERGADRRGDVPAEEAAIAVPLIIGGRAWGAIACEAGARALDDLDADLVAAVGEHLASSIRAADLYEQLTQSMIGTAEALAAALEAKDRYTADHARSIAELAVAVGTQMELPESVIEDLRYGGIFHDIGKIAVPDHLLNKPGPLSAEEFDVIKRHPAAGAEILASVPFLYGVRTIVRHAHEHWDGNGYPDGLRGAQIPLGARIVLAADAYHAMTSDRPYRSAMSHERACRELRENAGTQFDPEVVGALLNILGDRERT